MAKGAKTFTTMGSYFLRPHENFSSCNILVTEDVKSMDRKGMVVFYCVKCKQSFFGCSMFTLIDYSFFGKTRRYFFTATFSFCSSCVFSFLATLQYIGTTSMLY
jgi:hypothetical protein